MIAFIRARIKTYALYQYAQNQQMVLKQAHRKSSPLLRSIQLMAGPSDVSAAQCSNHDCYLSIDTDGSELTILGALDFN
jgi:hypothetical protein